MSYTVAIVGRPNVGKSTFFNRLLEQRKAIVDDISGVTRDRQYGVADWNGKSFNLIDTGGFVPQSEDIFEVEIRKQVKIAIDEANAIIFMVDVATGITDLDEAMADLLRRSSKPVFVVVNKVDNGTRELEATEFYSLGFEHTFFISSISGSGTGDLLDGVVANITDEEGQESTIDSELPKFAIIGQPNVGKSSLLNALVGEERTIVSNIAGTTRDTIEEQVKVGTHLIRIVDTAGIRESGDEIERIGIERSIEAIKESDIVVALFDASRAADSEDEQMLLLIKSYACDKHVIYLKNKIDLEQKFSHAEIKFDIELNSKESVDPLVVALENIMNSTNSSDEMMLISQRQISAVEYTLKNIEESFFPLRDQELEIFSFHLNEAVKEIASITRPFENDEMLEKMFGSFCLGK